MAWWSNIAGTALGYFRLGLSGVRLKNDAGALSVRNAGDSAVADAKFGAWLNTDGTENYKCRAWVNFNGTGTVAIRASGNVSSITDNGTGDYTVNFATAMPDEHYSFCFGGHGNTSTSTNGYPTGYASTSGGYTPTATSLRVRGSNGANGIVDLDTISVAIFR